MCTFATQVVRTSRGGGPALLEALRASSVATGRWISEQAETALQLLDGMTTSTFLVSLLRACRQAQVVTLRISSAASAMVL